MNVKKGGTHALLWDPHAPTQLVRTLVHVIEVTLEMEATAKVNTSHDFFFDC